MLPTAMQPRGFRLAWILAVAYLLVIVYASLQPFSGWRGPPDDIRRFFSAPWPRYVTLEDLLVNIVAYVPLGFLLTLGLMRRFGAAPAALLSAMVCAAFSLSMETVQMFMPTRIASNVDVLTNALGGLIGSLAAPLFSPSQRLGARLAEFRQWVMPGVVGDMGLVIACLWLLTNAHPTAQLFGTGNLRSTFELPIWFFHTPGLFLSAEAAVVFFNLLGLGLAISALTGGRAQAFRMIGWVVGLGLLLKIFAAVALVKTAGPLGWLTPGVALGLVAGAVLLYPLTHVPRVARLAASALCIATAVAIINLAPDNPYQAMPFQMIAGGPSHFLSFSGVIRALSELWPFLAVIFLAAASGTRLAVEAGRQRDRL
jgi:VanZ family protein